MADCTTVFETLKGFLPMNILEKAIDETNAEHGTKKFTVLRQLNTMTYAHLTDKKGLRDIEAGIVADKKLQEHTGTISFSFLSSHRSLPVLFLFPFEKDILPAEPRPGIFSQIVPNVLPTS